MALVYGFVAWNAFGYICYLYYKGKGDWAKTHGLKTAADEMVPQSVQFAKALGIEKATIKRYKGFEQVEEIDFEKTKKTPVDSVK